MPRIKWGQGDQRLPNSQPWTSWPTRNVPRPIVERLRMDGLTVRSVFEESRGIDDTHVLSLADEAGLILITQDHDFGALAILRRMPVAGILLLELTRLPLREQIERVSAFLAAAQENLAGKLTVVEPTRIRVRALPGPGR